ncbi:MAG: ATP-binding cassette domain-containing protein, partial [Flavobacteriaceae bacterium]|nr:ATP-binding cassette domain-containing protein [Flavobacteriaceae bacterium]
MIFEIDNVQVIRNNKSNLNGVYLKAESGQVTGLIGRNGSGKSTLFDIIFGNIQPKYKSIRVDGQP